MAPRPRASRSASAASARAAPPCRLRRSSRLARRLDRSSSHRARFAELRDVAVDLVPAESGPQLLRHGDVEIGNRQHLGLTPFEPSLRLLPVTLRAGAVAAGMEDVQQGAAAVAAPLLSAERFGAARDRSRSLSCRAACARTPAPVPSDACRSSWWRWPRGREAPGRRGCPPSPRTAGSRRHAAACAVSRAGRRGGSPP